MQNFLVVWIDSNIRASNKDLQETLAQLRSVVNHIELFIQPADCVKFLAELTDENAFVITSGTSGARFGAIKSIPWPELDAIFIFCGNQAFHEKWAKEWPKVKGVHTQIKPICEALQLAAKQVGSKLDAN